MSNVETIDLALRSARRGHTNVLRDLFAHGAVSVNQANPANGRCLLYLAARAGHRSTVALILEQKGVEIDRLSNGRWSALHSAAQWGKTRVVLQLLEAGADATLGNGKRAPIHSASSWARIDIIDILVDHGADVDTLDCCDRTPLWYAFFGQQRNAVAKLLERGANPIKVDLCRLAMVAGTDLGILVRNWWQKQEHERLVETAIIFKALGLPVLVVSEIYRARSFYERSCPAVSRHTEWQVVAAIKHWRR